MRKVELANRLEVLLARYCDAIVAWLRSPSPAPTTLEVDACFAALRLQQRLRWPEGSKLVDEVGLRAQDLHFLARDRGRASPAARMAMETHDRAVRDLRQAIASLQPEEVRA